MSDLVTRLLAEIDRREAKVRDMPDSELGTPPDGLPYWVDTDGHPIWEPKAEALRMIEAHRKIVTAYMGANAQYSRLVAAGDVERWPASPVNAVVFEQQRALMLTVCYLAKGYGLKDPS